MSQITVHILDTSLGLPAAEVAVRLRKKEGDLWVDVAKGKTNADGRVVDLLTEDVTLAAATYQMTFEIEPYFKAQGQPVFYPSVEVAFNVDDGGAHYHIPLLVSPFGYSTYRGS